MNYTVLHLHSMYGNGGFIDSTARPEEYIERAKELGMKAIAFSEHGNVASWYTKKTLCEENGLKYIHGIEVYVTETMNDKVRDNYHVCLYAKNFEGFKEINKLSSLSYKREQENRYHYAPRITFEELLNTSDNIIITSACLGGILSRGTESMKKRFLDFFVENKERCFLEVQHHVVNDQIEYNKELYEWSKSLKLKLVIGTDTHCLDETESRSLLQKAKKINFSDEETWDLTFKSYEELVDAYKLQNSLPVDVYMEAIENTNCIADMVEEFELDYSNKYPHVCDDPESVVWERIEEGLAYRGLNKDDYIDRINYELKVYKDNDALQYIMLEDKVKTFCRENNIHYGSSRGSVSGSFIAYLLQITDIDSVKWNMSFERFMSSERVSLADIDTDYPPSKRETVKEFLFNNSGMNCCDIITYNTVALKGAIRDCARGLDVPLDEVNEICKNIESDEDKYRKLYPELFKFVDKLNGCIVSVGSHPAGVCVSDFDLEEMMGTFTTKTSPFPIAQINMKEIDAQNYVKLDILGLDTIELIEKTCEVANIDWIETDKVDFNDEKIWNSIYENSCMIFQMESPFAHQTYKKVFNDVTLSKIRNKNSKISNIELFSMVNGAIRPSGESYRDRLSKGEFNDNGHEALNKFLLDTQGFLIYQEQILDFLHQFCNFTKGEADIVRRAISKKGGTEQHAPEIKNRFINTMNNKYGENTEKYEELVESYLQVIKDASNYGFSKNHSDPYSMTGYICAWLRHYYPLEFICSGLNVYATKQEKTAEIVAYAKLAKIKILPIKFGKSKGEYFMDKTNNAIYKGIGSINNMSNKSADELFELAKKNKYSSFAELILDIKNTSLNSQQLRILTQLDFFSDFGNSKELLKIIDAVEFFKYGETKKIKKDKMLDNPFADIVKKYSTDINKKGEVLKSYNVFDCKSIILDCEKHIKSFNMPDFSLKEKMGFQHELLGYISATGNENDRATLLIKEIKPVKRKKDGKQFGYAIITQSIGSGVESRFTIFNKDYKYCGELKKSDIIRCTEYTRDNGYYTMKKYNKLS